jgi:hypothetical protein
MGTYDENYGSYNNPQNTRNIGTHGMTIEMLIDFIQQDLTFNGMFPKILPDKEIKRIVREKALPWFYNNYQFAVQKSYFFLSRENLTHDIYTAYKYFILPDEIENITRIIRIDDVSLLRLGIQAPHLSINMGVTNQPFLTSFVTTACDLGVYRSILSAFSDEINKLNRPSLKFNYNHINKRLQLLTDVTTDLMLETYVRIEPEELFDFELFKTYAVGYAKKRMGQALLQFSFEMPGGFNYNADEIKTSGEEMMKEAEEQIKGETKASWFFMSR